MSLAAPLAIEVLDVAAILKAKRDDLVARAPEVTAIVDLLSEPLRKFIEVCAYRELLVRNRINATYLATFLAYAASTDLDHLAAFYDVSRIANETDAQLRARTTLAIRGRSTGGTEPRYQAIAFGASALVRDVKVWRDDLSPLINIAVIANDNGGIATPALLSAVEAALNDPSHRMVSDRFAVRSAVTVVQDVTAKIWLLPSTPISVFDTLDETITQAWGVEGGLGFDLTKAWLTARLMQPGVQRVEIVTPASDAIVAPHEAVALGTLTFTLEGRDR